VVALCAALGACAAVPTVDDKVSLSGAGSPPAVVGAHGPLTEAQSAALFARLGPAAAQDALQRHLAIEQAVADTPLIAGNRVRLLRDGEQTFRAIFAAIRAAKHHVNLEYYIFEDVESDGAWLGNLLVAKRAEGVAVNLIYDSYGSSATPSAFFDRLSAAGVRLVKYNPVNPLEAGAGGYAPNNRDHRKILIADGATAIVGGINLSATYEGHLPGMSVRPGDAHQHWRDTDLEIAGPAVAQLQRVFFEHWQQQQGPAMPDADYFPAGPAQGKDVVRIIGSAHDDLVPSYYVTVLSSIRYAVSRIWLSAAYFVPTHQEMEDLAHAARRGVDVRLLVPDHSDSQLAIAVQHSRYADLLEAGVRIYEIHGEVLHSKTIVIDGVWSVVGSSNFDQRSVLFNDEVDAVVLGTDTAQALEGMFRDDLAQARQIDPAAWADRPIADRVSDYLARLWQGLL
jgi:cardiolipin synthase